MGGSPAQLVNFSSVTHWSFEKMCACGRRPRRASKASLEPLPLGHTVNKNEKIKKCEEVKTET
jgi:hypothetical protein